MQTIRRQLNRLRRREGWLQLAWLGARCVAVLFLVLAVACLIDWLVDLRREIPIVLRVFLFAFQALLWLFALMALGVGLTRRPSDAEVALWVEEKMPSLAHRLISAVQLNRLGAA